MNFNDKLRELRDSKKRYSDEVQMTVDKINANLSELEEMQKKMDLKFAELKKSQYQVLDAYNNEIDDYCKLIESYSYFDARKIGKVIASLIRIFEGTNYIYQEPEYYVTEVKNNLKTRIKKIPRIIIAGKSRKSCYADDDDKTLNSFVKNGQAIVLTDDSIETKIPFYRANTGNHTLEQCVGFGRFYYAKDFIDELISYKMEHNLKDISYNELERLKRDFIAFRVQVIDTKYVLLAQQQEEQMRQKLKKDNQKRLSLLRRELDKRKK